MNFHPALYENISGIASPVDLVIAIDVVKDVSTQDLMKAKTLSKNLLKAYNISEYGTNVAILTYGADAKELLSLEDGSSKSAVEAALKGITVSDDGPRSASQPLAVARRILIDERRYDRKLKTNSQVIIFVMGDTSDEDRYRLNAVASQLERDDISLIIVGINVKNREPLKSAVKHLADLILVDDVKELKSKVPELEERSGKAAG